MTIVRRKPDQNILDTYNLDKSVSLGTYILLHSQPFSRRTGSNRALLFSPTVIFIKLGWGSPVHDIHSCWDSFLPPQNRQSRLKIISQYDNMNGDRSLSVSWRMHVYIAVCPGINTTWWIFNLHRNLWKVTWLMIDIQTAFIYTFSISLAYKYIFTLH